MAGKFLSLEEAARQLGVTVDDVHRFVDRKKLFPMRDGTTIKFKVDDVERLVHDLADEGSQSDGLALDLETPAAASAGEPDALGAGDLDLDLGDALDEGDSLFADGGDTAPPSQPAIREEAVGGDAGSGLSMPSESGASSAELVFGDSVGDEGGGNDDLNLESIVGASSIGSSSPSLAAATSGITGGPGELDETLAIDLGEAVPADAGGSLAVGSDAGLAGSPEATGAGLSLSGPLDSGLSLEEGGLEVSGIDLGGGSGATSADDGTVLGGDDFELGAGGADDDSASVVIASETDGGDSSFFGQAMGAEASAFGDESVGLPSSIASEAMGMPGDFAPEMTFSVWQTAGLICCSLLLLFGGFIAYDLVRTIGSPESTTLANPLLNAMADAFGWR